MEPKKDTPRPDIDSDEKTGGKAATYHSATTSFLTVNVPTEATIFVNGSRTKTPGESRQFAARNLEAGRSYRYQVRAELTQGGKKVTQEKTIYVRAGEEKSLAFDFATSDYRVTAK